MPFFYLRIIKVYRHPSCLVKHRWEHSPHWREASKFLLSKHQQVQLLEASHVGISSFTSGLTSLRLRQFFHISLPLSLEGARLSLKIARCGPRTSPADSFHFRMALFPTINVQPQPRPAT